MTIEEAAKRFLDKTAVEKSLDFWLVIIKINDSADDKITEIKTMPGGLSGY